MQIQIYMIVIVTNQESNIIIRDVLRDLHQFGGEADGEEGERPLAEVRQLLPGHEVVNDVGAALHPDKVDLGRRGQTWI